MGIKNIHAQIKKKELIKTEMLENSQKSESFKKRGFDIHIEHLLRNQLMDKNHNKTAKIAVLLYKDFVYDFNGHDVMRREIEK